MSAFLSVSHSHSPYYLPSIAPEQLNSTSRLQGFDRLPHEVKELIFCNLYESELIQFALTSKAALIHVQDYMQHIQSVLSENTLTPEIRHRIKRLQKQISYDRFLTLIAILAKPLSERKVKDIGAIALISQKRGNDLVNYYMHAQHLLTDLALIELEQLDLTDEEWQAFLAIPDERLAGGLIGIWEDDLAETEDLEQIESLMLTSKLFANTSKINPIDQSTCFPLPWAACKPSRESQFVKLLNNGADVHLLCNAKEENLWHIALKNKNPNLAKLLLDQQVSITQRDNIGRMPYHWAARHGYFGIFLILIHGLDIDIYQKLQTNQTVFDLAVMSGTDHLINWLLENGAKEHINNADNVMLNTPLHHAVSNASTNLAFDLLSHGANPNKQNKYLQSPFFQAVSKGDKKMVGLLLEFDADPTLVDHKKRTALSVAEGSGYFTIAELISNAIEENAKKKIEENAKKKNSHFLKKLSIFC